MDHLSEPAKAVISRGHCPDCGYRGFILGPCRGPAIDIECGSLQCRSRFTVTVHAGQVVLGQRIAKENNGANWGISD